MLQVRDLVVAYGAIRALHGLSFEVEEGEMVTLIGANGAGKSTTLWSIVGQLSELGGRVESGSITHRGESLIGVAAHEIVNRHGVSLVPEGRRVFGNLSVLENLKLAAFARTDKQGVASDLERVFSIFPRLEERKSQLADLLSGGEQQMLAVGRALMTHGRMMLLDEPSMGLAPVLVRQVFDTLVEINQAGTTMLVVEQNAHMALRHAHRAYVLQAGEVVMVGPAEEIAGNPEVQRAYLGA
jgi:branched-chain amino acid transport system ATP-binding protein